MSILGLLDRWKENKLDLVIKEWENVEYNRKNSVMSRDRKVEKGLNELEKHITTPTEDSLKFHVNVKTKLGIDGINVSYRLDDFFEWLEWDRVMFSDVTGGKRLVNEYGDIFSLPFVLGNGVIYVNDWFNKDWNEEFIYLYAKVVRVSKLLMDGYGEYIIDRDGLSEEFFKGHDIYWNALKALALSGMMEGNYDKYKATVRVGGNGEWEEKKILNKFRSRVDEREYLGVMMYLDGEYKNDHSVLGGEIREVDRETIDLGKGTYVFMYDLRYVARDGFRYDLKEEVDGNHYFGGYEDIWKGVIGYGVVSEGEDIKLGRTHKVLSEEESSWLNTYDVLGELF